MLHDPSRLEAALAPLVGLPLWSSHRAADIQIFQFGDKRTVTSNFGPRKGQEFDVGEYGLHIQCAWRIRGPSGIVVASRDRFYKAGAEPFPEDDWDWDAGMNRRDQRIREWLGVRSYSVERVSADATGGIVLSLTGGFALDVFPDDSLEGEYSERWRLLRPGDLGSHFVVSGNRIDG